MPLDICPKSYAASLFKRDTLSTAESFKSWSTCMDNKTCKIVAIVGICVAALLVIWILATFVQCLCMGVSCLSALCCCCCRGAHKNRYVEPAQQPYENRNMYPRQPPMMQMEQTYQPVPHYGGYEENRYKKDDHEYTGYKPLQF
ncbi:hypothetical protein METBIDRAFT_41293 [Metschnikowia bicuspidata var. bicuspidata NRRL YB-4993]|uniref:Uncharacterized protein n=1 Tax=Metschnikowia bicuspidata var. bicuspidata NRRL YB-4993 TaxID=869754 RepID=A0A1A0HA05_9ASCO|nr:hypothetical protein METBIDRAFT_41293 [Metschnikowia bicuspidata var. bicuspidata NRRL YB-4993]OBA20846.1 hypothetical protein METBIDRAFT_41293 [Metschnikowia bicuspidata var. bicuspidata NRRL YB-4993]